MKNYALLIIGSFLMFSFCFTSCVSNKKYSELSGKYDRSADKYKICSEELAIALESLEEQNELIAEFQEALKYLNADTATKGRRLRQLLQFNHEQGLILEDLKKQNNVLLDKSSREKEELSLKLANQQRELLTKQNDLFDLENSLADREKRIKELEALLAAKDSAVLNLQNKITEALISFDAEDLNVEVRDGKVYVTMSEKLLFKSGSREIDETGKDALGKIAEVLRRQKDVTIVVEGHTDNVPYVNPKGDIKNNWDLSVLRATMVVDILVKDNGLNADRVMASGRGEFYPVDTNDTKEGRARNRRTEIILSPDLSEIFNILNSN